MDEHFARRQADDLIRGHARIGASDPEIFGGLLIGQAREVLRILGELAFDPRFVVDEQLRERMVLIVHSVVCVVEVEP
jgi:hypothetical protein